MVELTIFPYDPQLWLKQRRWQWIFLLLLPLPGLICFLFTPLAVTFRIETMLLVGVVALLCMALLTYWIQQTSFRAQLQSYVVLKDDRLEHVDAKAVQSKREPVVSRYQDLTDLIVHQDASGKIINIRLVTKQKSVALLGFTHMDQLAAALRERLPASCRVKVERPKRYVLPALLFLLLIVLPLVWFVGWQELGADFVWLLSVPLAIYLAFRFLVYRPLAKVDPKSPWMDPVLGLMLVGLVVFRLVTHLDTAAAAFSDAPCSLSQRFIAQSSCLQVVPDSTEVYFLEDNDSLLWRSNDNLVIGSSTGWLGIWTPLLRHDDTVYSFHLAADRQTVATLSGELFEAHSIRVWHIESRRVLWETVYNDYLALRAYALAPDGTRLALVERDNIRLVDLTQGDESFLPLPAPNVEATVFTLDGTHLIVLADNVPAIYDITGQSQPQVLPAAAVEFTSFISMALSPDGQYLAVASGLSEDIAVWNLESEAVWQQPAFSDRGLDRDVAFSPDSRYLAVVGWGVGDQKTELSLWRAGDGMALGSLVVGEGQGNRANSVDFSPDGTRLIVGTRDSGFIFDVAELVGTEE